MSADSARNLIEEKGTGVVLRCALYCIRGYQYLISPLIPPTCRFYPSCSHYAAGAFRRFGFWRGLLLSAQRLLKCHPFHPGGFDPVPDSPDTYWNRNYHQIHG